MNRGDLTFPSTSGERVVPIAGSHNLRDMGGYKTADGRQVKWRTLYRSGVMAQLTATDQQEFRRLGIVTIYDLRENRERARRPTVWHQGEDIDYRSRDYEMSVGALDDLLAKGALVKGALMQVIHAAYRDLPFEQADSYRELFSLLTAGRVPLLFNCTAGKDRTGIAAALILFALGVPRQTIDHDYSLTELCIDKLEAILFSDPRYKAIAALPSEQYLPMLRADPGYLTIAFEEIERRHQSIINYLKAVLGVGPREVGLLREYLLSPGSNRSGNEVGRDGPTSQATNGK
jgi:protein-tyrosine phosphatase